LDETAARQAVEYLRDWLGERFWHRGLLGRAWDLRGHVRSWDANVCRFGRGFGYHAGHH
jgi:hypothetical protein